MQKFNLIFFGRLEQEKWFDIIVDALELLQNKYWVLNFDFNIFWDWTLRSRLLDNPILKTYIWKNIFYHWRVWKDIIEKYLKISHFTVVPSRFLETFGLVALESLALWVPVIWFKKWGLREFVFDNLDISSQDWSNDIEKLANLIKSFEFLDDMAWQDLSSKSLEVSKKYEYDLWINKFDEISFWSKKILMVSDYLPVIWWIENYISTLNNILSKSWYEVRLFWHKWFGWKIPKWFRLISLPFTWFNIWRAVKLTIEIIRFKPDLIRFHSINRFMWWMIPFVASFFGAKKFIMFHDFGYFHPYPSKVYEESQLDYKLSLKSFLMEAWSIWIFSKLNVFLKYLSSKLINIVLKKNIDLYLVPSSFMKKIVEKNYSIDSKKIVTLNHFIK